MLTVMYSVTAGIWTTLTIVNCFSGEWHLALLQGLLAMKDAQLAFHTAD